MSFAQKFFNIWLRWTEKRFLSRVSSPQKLRQSFERKAWFSFHAPWGTKTRDATLAGVPVTWVNEGSEEQPVILYFHGGAYVMGSRRSYRGLCGAISKHSGLAICIPEYRLAPENPFPAAIDDAMSVYRAIMDRPGGVLIGGDSAGGGLALALLGEILRTGLVSPRGVFAFSALTDMTFSGDSVTRNADSDVGLPAERTQDSASLYLADADARDPRASPLFAIYDGAPPIWLTAGSTEFLLDDTRRMAQRLMAQDVRVTELIENDLPHVWPLFHNYLPEARRTLALLAAWIKAL